MFSNLLAFLGPKIEKLAFYFVFMRVTKILSISAPLSAPHTSHVPSSSQLAMLPLLPYYICSLYSYCSPYILPRWSPRATPRSARPTATSGWAGMWSCAKRTKYDTLWSLVRSEREASGRDKYRVTSGSEQQCSSPGGAVLGTLQQEGCPALEVIYLWTDSPFILTRPE